MILPIIVEPLVEHELHISVELIHAFIKPLLEFVFDEVQVNSFLAQLRHEITY